MSEISTNPRLGDKAHVRPKPTGDPKRPRLIPWPPDASPPRYLRTDGESTRVRMDEYLLDIWRQGDLIVEPIPATTGQAVSPGKPKTNNQKPSDGGE